MENPRPEKVAVVTEVRERLDSASAAFLTEYRGLKVKELAGLRRSVREAGGEYKIFKNTLARFAARDAGLLELEALLEGPTAIAFVEGDAVSVAKALRDFARTNPALVVKGGVLGTKVLTARDATALADLPSREVLLARFAGAMAAPMVQFAGLLQALPRNFAYGLKALIDQKGGPPVASDEGLPEEPTAEVGAPAGDESGGAAGVGAPAATDEGSPEEPTAAVGAPAGDESGGAAGVGAPAASDEGLPEEPTTEQTTESE
jgi:large subunit ribosomal protein L10